MEHWRWNVDTTWHYFCSMHYEAVRANVAPHSFMRYHHVRSCIYFAVSVLESFLNQQMRKHLEAQEVAEAEIYDLLRNTPLLRKRNKWPTIICGRLTAFSEKVEAIFNTYRETRDEITHPKRKDHSIYVDLDNAVPDDLVDALSRALITIYEAKGEPFPYWVLGWNYVGMNNDPAFPCMLTNLNGFVWSLSAMGYNVNAGQGWVWEKRFMTTMNGYDQLKAALAEYRHDIEPHHALFPTKPRLTRRWWDKEFLLRELDAATRA